MAARKRGLTFRQAVDKYLKGEGDAAGKRAMAGKWVMGLRRRRIVAGVEACQNLPKERYAMKDDITITPLHQPGSLVDPLTEIARDGACRIWRSR